MGIRFRCHHCETELHVKDFQGGKRGRCPDCQGKFRVPTSDAEHSLAADDGPTTADSPDPGYSSSEMPTGTELSHGGSDDANIKAQQLRADAAAALQSAATPAVAPPAIPAMPRRLQTAADVKWYVRPPSGGQYGPAPSSTVWQWLSENRVGSDALVWCEGWPEWLIANDVFDDYFAAETSLPSEPQASPAAAAFPGIAIASPAVATSPASHVLPVGSTVDASATGERERNDRRYRRKRNYTVMIAILSVTMLVLAAALAIVLLRQSN